MMHVVTSVHNRYAITEKFVDSLSAQTFQPVHLVLVDDGSTDGTDQMVLSRMPGSTILYGDGNLWWGGALHRAYLWLRENAEDEDLVLISNDDTQFDEMYLKRGADLLSRYPDTLVVGSGFGLRSGEHLDGIFHHSFEDGTGQLLPPGSEGNCASTRSLFLTVGMWKKIGGLHPHLLPHYFSDFEFTIRAGRKGFALRSFEELTYRFDEGATGDNQYEKLTLKKLFGKRSGLNPVYRLSFIFLTTPVHLLPKHLWNQAKRYFAKINIIRRLFRRGRTQHGNNSGKGSTA